MHLVGGGGAHQVLAERGTPVSEAEQPGIGRPGAGLMRAGCRGAGNVTSLAPLDIIQKLFVEGHVVILKFNPINEYIGPYVEHAFARMADAGFVRFAYGGASVGEHLVRSPAADEVHVTGSESTYNAIVFGDGSEGAARRARNEPLLTKRITAELGNVSPVIVVPGRWAPRDGMAPAAPRSATRAAPARATRAKACST